MTRNKTSFLLIMLVLITILASADDDKTKAVESITIEELKEHLNVLASDDFMGRRPGSEGYRKAVAYTSEQFKISGLKTLFKDENGNPSYLQGIKMVQSTRGENNALILHTPDGPTSFGKDQYFLFRPGKEPTKEYEPLEVVFVGFGIDEPEAGYSDYTDVDLEGKIAVMMMGAPIKQGKFILPAELNQKYLNPVNGTVPKLKAVFQRKAAGVVVIAMPMIAFQWEKLTRMVGKLNISLAPEEMAEGEEPDEVSMAMNPPVPMLIAHPKMVNVVFKNQQYDPIKRKGKYGSFTLKDLKLEMKVDMPLQPFTTHNVVAFVEGTDPVLKHEYITLGAHLDHLGMLDEGVANGADDNGSGSVAILEIAEALAMNPPKRSVILILYSSEELGLIGSKYFVDHPPVPIEDIIVNINLDMVGRDTKNFPDGIYATGSTRLSQEFKPVIVETNENTIKMPLSFAYDTSDPENHWGRSDQINFHRRGVPAVFFSSGSDHEDYHKATDDIEKINFVKIRDISRLCYEICQALGEKEKRLALTK